MLKSSLSGYINAYVLISETITITREGADNTAKQTDEKNKEIIFQNYAPITVCISEINDTQIDKAQDLDVVMSVFNFIGYSDNYSRTSGSLWEYYKDE